MLLLVILFCIVAGSAFHMYFSVAFCALAASVFLNHSDNLWLGALVLFGTFLAISIAKYAINKNVIDGIVDFDLKNTPELVK